LPLLELKTYNHEPKMPLDISAETTRRYFSNHNLATRTGVYFPREMCGLHVILFSKPVTKNAIYCLESSNFDRNA